MIHLSAHFSHRRDETPRLEGCKSAVSWTPESPHENMSCALQRVRRGRIQKAAFLGDDIEQWSWYNILSGDFMKGQGETNTLKETKSSSSLWPSSPTRVWTGGEEVLTLSIQQHLTPHLSTAGRTWLSVAGTRRFLCQQGCSGVNILCTGASSQNRASFYTTKILISQFVCFRQKGFAQCTKCWVTGVLQITLRAVRFGSYREDFMCTDVGLYLTFVAKIRPHGHHGFKIWMLELRLL